MIVFIYECLWRGVSTSAINTELTNLYNLFTEKMHFVITSHLILRCFIIKYLHLDYIAYIFNSNINIYFILQLQMIIYRMVSW